MLPVVSASPRDSVSEVAAECVVNPRPIGRVALADGIPSRFRYF